MVTVFLSTLFNIFNLFNPKKKTKTFSRNYILQPSDRENVLTKLKWFQFLQNIQSVGDRRRFERVNC